MSVALTALARHMGLTPLDLGFNAPDAGGYTIERLTVEYGVWYYAIGGGASAPTLLLGSTYSQAEATLQRALRERERREAVASV